jgi:hypothetical protein
VQSKGGGIANGSVPVLEGFDQGRHGGPLPVALVNKLVSLSDHPSSRILRKFAIKSMRC